MPPRNRTTEHTEPVDTSTEPADTSTDPNEVRPLTEEGERRVVPVRARQFPSLYGAPEVEVAERSPDVDEDATSVHVKDFVTTKRDFETGDQDAMHERNSIAVRQYLANQGLRPDAKVQFEGEHEHPWDAKSVILRYIVSVVPAAVATDYDVAHAPVSGDDTATERAEHDAQRVDRLRASHDALRYGTPEADRPNATE